MDLLVELRCPNDGKLLLKASEVPGLVVQAKCSRCRETITASLEGPAVSEEGK